MRDYLDRGDGFRYIVPLLGLVTVLLIGGGSIDNFAIDIAMKSMSVLLLVIMILYGSDVVKGFTTTTTTAGAAAVGPRNTMAADTTTTTTTTGLSSSASNTSPESDPKHVETILFVECGFGADAHGQDSTKAAVRACRNAIEFNQIPSIATIVPGGRDNMKLDVLLAVPAQYQNGLNLDEVRKCFPYGQVNIQIQNGGMIATSGVMIEEMGDKNEDMVVVCVAVTVGY